MAWQLTGEGGLLAQPTKRLVESALEGEITDHLGYDKHDAAVSVPETRLTSSDLLLRRGRKPGMIRRWRCG